MRNLSFELEFSNRTSERVFFPPRFPVDGYKELVRWRGETCRVLSIKVSHVPLCLWLVPSHLNCLMPITQQMNCSSKLSSLILEKVSFVGAHASGARRQIRFVGAFSFGI